MSFNYFKKEDIHYSQKGYWKKFYDFCFNGNYQDALDYYRSHVEQIFNATYNESLYNTSANNLTYLQNLKDDTFKSDKIKVSKTPPGQMTKGQIYFKEEE